MFTFNSIYWVNNKILNAADHCMYRWCVFNGVVCVASVSLLCIMQLNVYLMLLYCQVEDMICMCTQGCPTHANDAVILLRRRHVMSCVRRVVLLMHVINRVLLYELIN